MGTRIAPEICVAGRDLTEPTLSPDGSMIACVVAEAGVAGIAVTDVRGGPERRVSAIPPPAPGRGLAGGCLTWVHGGSAVMYVGRDGALWVAPVTGGTLAKVMEAPVPPAGAPTPEGGLSAPRATDRGDLAVVALADAEVWLLWPGGGHPPMRLDLGEDDFVMDPFVAAVETGTVTGEIHVVWQAWNVPDMAWDRSEVCRVRLELTDDPWAPPVRIIGRERTRGEGAILQPQVMADGTLSSVRDDEGWLNLWCGDRALIPESHEHAGPTWGPGLRSYAWSPDGHAVAFTRNEGGFARLCVAQVTRDHLPDSPARVTDIRILGRGVHGHLDWRGEHLVALRTGARTPTQVVSYALGHGAALPESPARQVHLVGPVAAWDLMELPEPELLALRIADEGDGVTSLHARVYSPTSAPRGCIAWVHGGPTDQWQVTFMPRVAWLCSLGLEVVVVDPRGSTGHGRRYQQALRGRWGDLDGRDTARLIEAHQRSSGIEPARTLIAGSSSGGLTVLAALGRHRDLVAGGIAISPVSDLADLAARSHRFEAHYTLSLVGDPADREHYAELSPVHFAEQIHGPLLVMHGEQDPVVPVDHSRVLAERIRSGGGEVELHLFPSEGHGLRQIPNRLEEYRLIERFIDRLIPADE